MKEFNGKHTRDLRGVDGSILQGVKGKIVTVGLDSEHPSVLDSITDCIDDYTARTLAVYLNFGSARNILHQIYDNMVLPFDDDLLKVRLMNASSGVSTDDYAKKLERKQWHLDDVVEEEEGHKAMIVEDNGGDYILMDINPDCVNAFQVSEFFGCSSSLRRLRELSYNWHKVTED